MKGIQHTLVVDHIDCLRSVGKEMDSGCLLSSASARISVIISVANKGEHPGENPNYRWLCAGSSMGFACKIICFSTILPMMEVIVMCQ